MNIFHKPNDYSNIKQVLNISIPYTCFLPWCDKSNLDFSYSVLNGSLDIPELLVGIPFKASSHSSKNQSQFYVPTHKTSYCATVNLEKLNVTKKCNGKKWLKLA